MTPSPGPPDDAGAWSFDGALAPTSPRFTAPIPDDRPCIRCGYNIRGLDPTGECPECGVRLALSLRSRLLKHADPAYVRRLHRGARTLFWAFISVFFLFGGRMAAGAVITILFGSAVALGAAMTMLSIAWVGAVAWGLWLVTSPDPARFARATRDGARRTVRWALGAAAAGYIVQAVAALFVVPPTGASGVARFAHPINLLTLAGAGAVIVAAPVAYFALLAYLRRIGWRVPSRKIVKWCGTLNWMGVVLVMLYAIGAAGLVVLSVLAVIGSAPWAFTALGVLAFPTGCGGTILAFVIFLLLINLLGWLSRSLGTIVRASGDATPDRLDGPDPSA